MFEDIDDAAYAGSAYRAAIPVIRVSLSPLLGHELAAAEEGAAAIGSVPFGKPAHELPGLCIRNA